jgi:hypothetical protein
MDCQLIWISMPMKYQEVDQLISHTGILDLFPQALGGTLR